MDAVGPMFGLPRSHGPRSKTREALNSHLRLGVASDATAPQRSGGDSRLRDAAQTLRRLRTVDPRTALPAFDTRGTLLLITPGEGVAAQGFRQDHRTPKPATFGPFAADFEAEG